MSTKVGVAKKVTWRDHVSETPSHFTDIDNDRSVVMGNLAGIRAKKFDTAELVKENLSKLRNYERKGCCSALKSVKLGEQTLFVNAAIEGTEQCPQQLPWEVELRLPRSGDTPTGTVRKWE